MRNQNAKSKIIRIDSHQHFWERKLGYYTWLNEGLGPIYKDFSPEDLRPYLQKSDVVKTVVIQAAEDTSETDYLLSLAEKTDFIAAVVGWVDMQDPNAPNEMVRLAQNPYLKGIRPMIQDIEDDKWMLGKQLHQSFMALQNLDLCFDALVRPRHLKALLEVAKRYPTLKIVIDHAAKPDIQKHDYARWAEDISALGKQNNVYCKLSGLVTEAGSSISFNGLVPYMQHILDTFSPSRLMWGSDWPVLNLAANYSQWIRITEDFLRNLDTEKQQQIWSKTAIKFYNLAHVS